MPAAPPRHRPRVASRAQERAGEAGSAAPQCPAAALPGDTDPARPGPAAPRQQGRGRTPAPAERISPPRPGNRAVI